MLLAALLLLQQPAEASVPTAAEEFRASFLGAYAEAPALHLDAQVTASMGSGEDGEEASAIFDAKISIKMTKTGSGTISIAGKTYDEPGEEESAEAMDMALLGDGETFWQVYHGDQTALTMEGMSLHAFTEGIPFAPLAVWAGGPVPGGKATFSKNLFGVSTLTFEEDGMTATYRFQGRTLTSATLAPGEAMAAFMPTLEISNIKVTLPEKADPADYAATPPEGYEIESMDLAFEDEDEEGGMEAGLIELGSAAPTVDLIDLDTGSFALESLRGKTVLLNFWFYH